MTLFALIISDNSIIYKNVVIHDKAELGKVCQTTSGENLILSKRKGKDISVISRLDKGGNFVYHELEMGVGYTGNAQIMESKLGDGKEGFTLYHKASGKDYFKQIKVEDDEAKLVEKKEYSTYSEQASGLTLSNGKVFF